MGLIGKAKSKVVRWFVRRELEDWQEQLQQSQKEGKPMKMSPAVKAAAAFGAGVVLQVVLTYVQTAQAPTLKGGINAVAAGILSSVLFWMRSGRPPTAAEVAMAMAPSGNIRLLNDDPKDPVVVVVDGTVIAPPAPPGGVTPPVLKG